ncbi:hypothetical protein FEE95_21725 [Maribacter algarum]|uniref:Uncharacterized protein n=1 Tax=Maribacter algarum (ex Zhang et al. 2020) TaxID=2578118 RepID=A0A5S3PDP5_9FLAO|nr:hypothetical protein [Maribacter algarum]TMM52033.1 hypothetical protein FEE95_21725 [Maribacter algarum]
MSKEILIKGYVEKVNKNYNSLEYYFDDELKFLQPLNLAKYEVINCLMIEQFNAAITLTNHMTERMLKLALIEKTTHGLKISEKDINELNKTITEASNLYDSEKMSQTIKLVYNEGLITEQEKTYLDKVIRDKIRNSFSHAEMEKVNKGKKDQIELRSFKFTEVQKSINEGSPIPKKQIKVSTKVPFLQSEIQKMKAEEIAFPYFKNIYKIAKNIDRRLDVKKEYYK